eukprot:150734-Hanusia_phi.AAC.1
MERVGGKVDGMEAEGVLEANLWDKSEDILEEESSGSEEDSNESKKPDLVGYACTVSEGSKQDEWNDKMRMSFGPQMMVLLVYRNLSDLKTFLHPCDDLSLVNGSALYLNSLRVSQNMISVRTYCLISILATIACIAHAVQVMVSARFPCPEEVFRCENNFILSSSTLEPTSSV